MKWFNLEKIEKKYLLLFILGLGFILYLNAMPNDFLWDDEEQIVANQLIRHPANIPKLFFVSTGYAFGTDATVGFYRPLMFLVYLFAYQVSGLTPWVFHFFQLVFHLANLVLLFLILEHILKSQNLEKAKEIAFFTCLFFAVHPANSEAIVYLGAMGEPLYSFFVLAAFLLFLHSFNNPQRKLKPKYFLSSLLLGFIGLFAKETALIVFGLMFVYLLIFIKPRAAQLINYLFAFASVAGVYLLVRLAFARISFAQPHVVPIAQASFFQRLLTIPSELLIYFGLAVFPKNLMIYRHFVVPSPTDIRFWGAGVLLALFGFGLYLFGKTQPKPKQKIILFSLAWIAITILPALNIIPLNMTVAERWLYLPLMAIIFIVAVVLVPPITRLSKNFQLLLLGLVMILMCLACIRTIIRNTNWRNGLTLYGHDIQINPNNASLENNYGVELFRAGDFEGAATHIKKSVELEPKWAISRNNLGAIYEKNGNDEAALAEYKAALKLSDYYLAYQNLAGILIKLKRVGEAKNFLENEAIPRFPASDSLYATLAALYWQENDFETAYSLAQKAYFLNPGNAQAEKILESIGQKNKKF